MRRRSTIYRHEVLFLLIAACGNDTTSVTTGGGSGGNDEVSSSPSGDPGVSESTLSPDDGSADVTTGDALECVQSDLPPPFCHLQYDFEISTTTAVAGLYPHEFEGIRPVILVDNESDQFALADPRQAGRVFRQGDIPVDLQPLTVTILAADLTHDGVADFVVYPGGNTVSKIVVLDGATLDEVAQLETDPTTTFSRGVACMDVDGNGTLELVTADDRTLASSVIQGWSLDSPGFELVFSHDTGVDFPPAGWPRGLLVADLTGDGQDDFTYAWGEGAQEYLPEGSANITTLVGPSQSGDLPSPNESVQPVVAVRADTADMDDDGDAEVVIAAGVETVYILDWNGVELQTAEILELGEQYEANALGILNAGRLSANRLGGVFLGGVLHEGADPAESFVGASFVSGVDPRFVERDGRFVADVNNDGVDDFFAADGFFVSALP